MPAPTSLAANIRRRLLAAVLPQDCVLCGRAGSYRPHSAGHAMLCAGCQADLPYLPQPGCPACALPTAGGSLCGRCVAKPPQFDATLAVLAYRYPVEPLMQFYKYRSGVAIGALLASLLEAAVPAQPDIDCIAFIPLSRERLAERGFNQALEIARPLARARGIALRSDLAVRVRHTGAQAELPFTARRKNVRGAFACVEDLSGLRVAVVDDVMTTGATLDEFARTLKKRGAARVENWVVARALLRN
jgi:ComF family protein